MSIPIAEIIADSVNRVTGDRITTFVLTYPRFIHAEFMTHRMFSRNASSSRAIPVEKMIKRVRELKIAPTHWGKNQKGMQASTELEGDELEQAQQLWDEAREQALKTARSFINLGVHKQIANRVLEPFNTITVICTATEYQNFFKQRCHPDAQPEIQALAYAMKELYDSSNPNCLEVGEWHLPFVNQEDINSCFNEELVKISTGRSARVSYLNHDGKRSIEDDLNLHSKLISSRPPHLSPFEHPAQAMPSPSFRYGNLTGFQSYRYQLEMIGEF